MKLKLFILASVGLFMVSGWVSAATPGLDELWTIVQQQQQRIEHLERQLEAADIEIESANRAIDEHNVKLSETVAMAESTASAVEMSAFDTEPKVSIGGYGELHYNDTDRGEQIDFHRFVLYFGHQFSSDLSFYSEVELEHSLAGDGAPGEVELEQAFIQWDYAAGHNAKGGLFLLPIGLLNETHEPDTFFGVERNSIENQIIPTTWWEAGAMFSGEIAPGWGYDLAIHSGLQLDTGSANLSRRSNLRSGRQKVAEANGDSLAYTARLSYSGIPGFRWGVSMQYQTDLTQSDAAGTGISNIDGTLFETNVDFERGILGLRALYAQWMLDERIELLNPGAEEQFGWYVEPSIRFEKLGVFARYGTYDLTAGSGAMSNENNQFNIGVNYWMHENVVIKADLQRQDNSGGDSDGFNVGIGYSF